MYSGVRCLDLTLVHKIWSDHSILCLFPGAFHNVFGDDDDKDDDDDDDDDDDHGNDHDNDDDDDYDSDADDHVVCLLQNGRHFV